MDEDGFSGPQVAREVLEWYASALLDALEANGGSISATNAELTAWLQWPKDRVSRAVKRCRETGWLRVKRQHDGRRRFTLPQVAPAPGQGSQVGRNSA